MTEAKPLSAEEIEITPEMIEAGLSALLNFSSVDYVEGWVAPKEIVVAVYQAMLAQAAQR